MGLLRIVWHDRAPHQSSEEAHAARVHTHRRGGYPGIQRCRAMYLSFQADLLGPLSPLITNPARGAELVKPTRFADGQMRSSLLVGTLCATRPALVQPRYADAWHAPRMGERACRAMRCMADEAATLAGSAASLLEASEHLLAAAAGPDDAAWSAAGSALASAARELNRAGDAIADGDWPCATEPLAAAASSFARARFPVGEALLKSVSAELLDASNVSGCISLAAAAGPNLVAAAEALAGAGSALCLHGAAMPSTSSSRLQQAGLAIVASSKQMHDCGELLELGRLRG